MTRTRSISFAVLLAVAAMAGAALIGRAGDVLPIAGGDSRDPKLRMERRTCDFGVVSAGTVLRTNFTIRNTGGARLILEEQSHSCGCLSGGVPEIVVPPGAFRRIEITFRTDRLEGAVRKQLEYRTNVPWVPTLRVAVRAEVRRDDP